MDPSLNEKKHTNVPIRKAAELSKYSTGYLSSLCRTGKIVGTYSHNEWSVDIASLERFIRKQAEHKEARARSLAEARSREYFLQQDTQQSVTPKSFGITELFSLVDNTARSHVLALSLAVVVVASGALAAGTVAVPQLLERIEAVAQETASGFSDTFGDIPSRIASRIEKAEDTMVAVSQKVASHTTLASLAVVSPLLAEPDFSLLQMPSFESEGQTFQNASIASVQTVPMVTSDEVQSSLFALYTFVTTPSHIVDSLVNAYVAFGERAYVAIGASFFAHNSLIEQSGTEVLAAAATTRDMLVATPLFVTRVNLAFGNTIIDVTHAVIRADVSVSYGLAAAGPESARATVALLGSTGDLLARATSRAPALATALFLRATEIPSHLGPALAQAVFNVEYASAHRFVALTDTILPGEVILPQLPVPPDFPAMFAHASATLQDAYLGTLGKI